MDELIEQDAINAMTSSDSDGDNDSYSDDDISTTPFHVAYDDMPGWCAYNGTDAFKIVLFLSVAVIPLGMFALAYSFRLWRAKVDVVSMYLENGMSVRGTVVERKSKRRMDYEGRTYHSHEIVVEYDPLFVACFVEEGRTEDEDDEGNNSNTGRDDNNADEKILMDNLRENGSINNCERTVYRKRLRVSKDTFHSAAFGSIRLLVLEDSRSSAFPVRELSSLQLNSGVCWVWCFGLIVIATLTQVVLHAACANLWYCWLASIVVAAVCAYLSLMCTRGVYRNFVDSILVGDTQEYEKNDVPKSIEGGCKGTRFTRLTRVHSEPVRTTTPVDEVKCAQSHSESFVLACPLVKI